MGTAIILVTGLARRAWSRSAEPVSTWNNSYDLYVGNFGSGVLSISSGGSVTVGGASYVGFNAGSTGTINFSNGTLTTQSLYASPSQLTGTGTIKTGGLVSDVNLVFDSTHGLSRTLPGFGSVTVNLDMSNPSNVGDLVPVIKAAVP